MSSSTDEVVERLLGTERMTFALARGDVRRARRALTHVLDRTPPPDAVHALAAAPVPHEVTERWLRAWFLGWTVYEAHGPERRRPASEDPRCSLREA